MISIIGASSKVDIVSYQNTVIMANDLVEHPFSIGLSGLRHNVMYEGSLMKKIFYDYLSIIDISFLSTIIQYSLTNY